jgi:RNA polymerase sigma factor for flagellar operon FliA
MDDASRRIKELMPLAKGLAYGLIRKRGLPPQSAPGLLSAALLGLNEAFENFEEGHGATFTTYAVHRMNGTMLDELRADDPHTRNFRTLMNKAARTHMRLCHELLREPRLGEMAQAMEMSLNEYEEFRCRCLAGEKTSFDMGDYMDQEDARGNDSWMGEDSPEDALILRQKLGCFFLAFESALDNRQRFIITSHYVHDVSYEDIGKTLGITGGRVSQIEEESVEKMRKWLSVRGW